MFVLVKHGCGLTELVGTYATKIRAKQAKELDIVHTLKMDLPLNWPHLIEFNGWSKTEMSAYIQDEKTNKEYYWNIFEIDDTDVRKILSENINIKRKSKII